MYKSLFFIPIYPHSSRSSSWVVSPLITSLDDPIKWSGLFAGSSWVAHRMAISSPASTLGSSCWVLIAMFWASFSQYHRLLPVLLAPISCILVAPLKKISVLGGWGRGRARPWFTWVLHFALGSVKMWKHVEGSSSICIDGLKVIIPFSSFIASRFLFLLVGESERPSSFSGCVEGLNLGYSLLIICSAVLTQALGFFHPSVLSFSHGAHWQSCRSW